MIYPSGDVAETVAGSATPSLVALLNVMLRGWRAITVACVAAVIATATVVVMLPRSYVATASFVEQSPSGSSNFAGVAAQLGFQLPTATEGQPPQFYQDLVHTRTILFPVLADTFTLSDRRTLTLIDLDGGPTDQVPAVRRELAFRKLDNRITTSLASRTGVVTIAVRGKDPILVAGIASRVLKEIDRYNLTERQSSGRREREFTGQRRDDAVNQLHAAEDQLAEFASRNRGSNSPFLTTQHDRLARVVAADAAVVQTLNDAFERARINELRDTPVLTVVESAVIPAIPEPRRLVTKCIMAALIAFAAAFAFALIRARMSTARALGSPDLLEFDAIVRRA